MPGHSIAVVRALKSGLWAMAGGKAGLKAIPGRRSQAYPLSEFGVLYTPDVLVGRHNACCLRIPLLFGIPRSSSFILEHASVTQRFAHLPLLLGGSHWILVQFSSQEAPRRFRKKEFLDQSQEVVTALRACDSASCRRRARDKGIPILNTDSEIPIRKFGNSEIRTVFWQEG